MLRRLYRSRRTTLPKETEIPFSDVWAKQIEVSDRRQALRAYEAATLEELRRALRSGEIWSNNSLQYREHEATLIDRDDWETNRSKYAIRLAPAQGPGEFLDQLDAAIRAGMAAVDDAVGAGELRIRDDELRLPGLKEERTEGDDLRSELFSRLGGGDLPEIIVEVDSQVRFS